MSKAAIIIHPLSVSPHNRCSCRVCICLFCFLFKEGEEESKSKGIVFTPRAPSAEEKKKLPRLLIRRSSSSGDRAWALTWTLARGAALWSVQREIKRSRGCTCSTRPRLHRRGFVYVSSHFVRALGGACQVWFFFFLLFFPSFSLLCRGDGNQQTEYRQQRRLQPLEVCSP